jgi:hypothetical protein
VVIFRLLVYNVSLYFERLRLWIEFYYTLRLRERKVSRERPPVGDSGSDG